MTKRYDGGGKASDSTDTATVRQRESDTDFARDEEMRDYARRAYESTWRNDPEGRKKVEDQYGPPDYSKFGRKSQMTISPSVRIYNKGGAVKHGSPAHTAPCRDSKTIKCY